MTAAVPLTGTGSRWDTPRTLHDGSVVSSYSTAFREQCEALYVLSLSNKLARLEYLRCIEAKRGKESAEHLRALIMDVWSARRAG